MPTPQSPNTKPVNNTGNTYVHPDHGLIATITKGVSDFVKGGGLMGKPAPKPEAPWSAPQTFKTPKGTITLRSRTDAPQKPLPKPNLKVTGN